MAGGHEPNSLIVAMVEGHVWTAPPDVTTPDTESEALAAGWDDVGLISDQGVKLAASFTDKDVNAWTYPDPVLSFRTARSLVASAVMLQFDAQSLPLAFGGGEVVDGGYDFPDFNLDIRQLLYDFYDQAENHHRIIIPKGRATENVDTSFVHTDAAGLPFGFKAMKIPGTPIAKWRTDAPGFAAAGS